MELAVEICQVCLQLPSSGKLIISAQLQEAALAIPTTIARGSKSGRTGFVKALAQASQTAAELETLLTAAHALYKNAVFADLNQKTLELQSAIAATGRRLQDRTPPQSL